MAKQGINPRQIKLYNDTAVLYLLSAEGTISRKAIASKLGLTAAAVTKITKRLIESGKIIETGDFLQNNERAGRREVLLSLNGSDKLTLGITAELDSVTYSLCDVCGNLINKRSFPFFDNTDLIIQRAKQFLKTCTYKPEQLIGIGVCVIGSVEKNSYGVWDNALLINKLEAEFGIPVAAENNIKAYALAELIYGNVPDNSFTLFFKWGMGIGSAVALSGEVIADKDSSLTEIGHYIVDPSGKKCRCGRFGCLETVASAKAMSDEAGGLSLEEMLKSDDKNIINIIDGKINTVALALTNTATILNAKRIVLFGSIFENEQIEQKLIRQCERYNADFNSSAIAKGSLADKSSYIGAAAVSAQRFFFGSY